MRRRRKFSVVSKARELQAQELEEPSLRVKHDTREIDEINQAQSRWNRQDCRSTNGRAAEDA